MEPLATEPLVVLTSASPIVGELLGEKRIVVCHSATGYASGPRRMSAPTRGIERHPRSLTDPLFAAYTDATLELRANLDGVGLSRRAHRALAHSPATGTAITGGQSVALRDLRK